MYSNKRRLVLIDEHEPNVRRHTHTHTHSYTITDSLALGCLEECLSWFPRSHCQPEGLVKWAGVPVLNSHLLKMPIIVFYQFSIINPCIWMTYWLLLEDHRFNFFSRNSCGYMNWSNLPESEHFFAVNLWLMDLFHLSSNRTDTSSWNHNNHQFLKQVPTHFIWNFGMLVNGFFVSERSWPDASKNRLHVCWLCRYFGNWRTT